MNQRPRPDLRVIVEVQAIELRRLVKDNERLNKRVDRLIDELAALRDLQGQEIDLRRDDQQARARAQESLNGILATVIERGGLAGPRPADVHTFEGNYDQEPPKTAAPARSSRRLAMWMVIGGVAGGVLGLLSVVSSDPIVAALQVLAGAAVGVLLFGVAAVIRTLSEGRRVR